MTHSKILFTILLSTLISFVSFGQKNASYSLDTKKSTIKWKGEKVTGEHTGNLVFKSGEIKWNKGEFNNGTFEVDMTSLTSTDLEGEMAEKLIGHLKSNDFFSIKDNPTSQLVITSGQQDKSNSSLYHFKGDLTIKKITHPISFDAQIDKKDNNIHVKTELKIDRTKYDIRYGSGKFFDNLGDKVIYDEFTLIIDAILTAK